MRKQCWEPLLDRQAVKGFLKSDVEAETWNLDSENSSEREGVACAKGLRQEARPEALLDCQQADSARRGRWCGVSQHGTVAPKWVAFHLHSPGSKEVDNPERGLR